jgi:16S rRNA processing protein RimM
MVAGQDVKDEYVILGRISGVFGVQGWVKVYSETRPRENILEYGRWWLRRPAGWQEAKLLDGRLQGEAVVARLEGVTDRDVARSLIGTEIAIERSQLPKPKRGEYYWADLEGMKVVNLEGVDFGTVSHLFETGANDVLVVTDGERERLVPFTKDAVKEVDLKSRVIRVDWDAEF